MTNYSNQSIKRTGIANGTVEFPENFDADFDNMDAEIAEMFYGAE